MAPSGIVDLGVVGDGKGKVIFRHVLLDIFPIFVCYAACIQGIVGFVIDPDLLTLNIVPLIIISPEK